MKFNIIADSREKTPWYFPEDEHTKGTYIQKLDVGDYSLDGFQTEFVIERKKSTSEIATNFTEKRWPDFLDRLRNIPKAFFVCEFSLDDVLRFPLGSNIPRKKLKFVKISPQFLLSKLADIQLLGIHVVYAGDTENAQNLSYLLMKKFWNSK